MVLRNTNFITARICAAALGNRLPMHALAPRLRQLLIIALGDAFMHKPTCQTNSHTRGRTSALEKGGTFDSRQQEDILCHHADNQPQHNCEHTTAANLFACHEYSPGALSLRFGPAPSARSLSSLPVEKVVESARAMQPFSAIRLPKKRDRISPKRRVACGIVLLETVSKRKKAIAAVVALVLRDNRV